MDGRQRDRCIMAWRSPPVSVRATAMAIVGLAALASGVTAQGSGAHHRGQLRAPVTPLSRSSASCRSIPSSRSAVHARRLRRLRRARSHQRHSHDGPRAFRIRHCTRRRDGRATRVTARSGLRPGAGFLLRPAFQGKRGHPHASRDAGHVRRLPHQRSAPNVSLVARRVRLCFKKTTNSRLDAITSGPARWGPSARRVEPDPAFAMTPNP